MTDATLAILTTTGILVDNLKEIIPPLAHRLLILNKLNEQVSKESEPLQGDTVNANFGDEDNQQQVKCTLCLYLCDRNWNSLWNHLRYFHLFTQTKLMWTCPFCKSTLMRFKNFKHHVESHLSHQLGTPRNNQTSPLILSDEPWQSMPNDLLSNDLSISNEDLSIIEDTIAQLRVEAVKFVVQLIS